MFGICTFCACAVATWAGDVDMMKGVKTASGEVIHLKTRWVVGIFEVK